MLLPPIDWITLVDDPPKKISPVPPSVCVPGKLSVAPDIVTFGLPDKVRPSFMVTVPLTVIGDATVTPSRVPPAAMKAPVPEVAIVPPVIVPFPRMTVP